MAALVSIEDLQAYMKLTFSGSDRDQADAVLIGVSALARAISGQSWSDAPTSVPEDVQAVVKLATKRLLERLGRDESVESETMGPFSVSYFENPESIFSHGELGFLRRFRTASGLIAIRTSRGERGCPHAGQVRLGVNGSPWTIFEPGDLGWYDPYGPYDWDGDPFPW